MKVNDEILDRLNAMNPQDVANMVQQELLNAGFEIDENGDGIVFSGLSNYESDWVSCKDCIYFQEGDCDDIERRDGCYNGLTEEMLEEDD